MNTEGTTVDGTRWGGAPQTRSMSIGDVTVTYIQDGTAQIAPSVLLPDSPPSFWDANTDLLDPDGYLLLGAGGLLVRGDDWSILIDTGLGPLAITPSLEGLGHVQGGALLTSLARQGLTPAQLSAIAITHLHADHIGWWANGTGADGRGPFADLPAYIGAAGWEHGKNTGDPTLAPAIEALAPAIRPVADGTTIAPGVTVLATAGHTPEHTAYVIESRGQRLIAFGDAFHSTAQFAHPEWADSMDHDASAARATRMSLLHMLTEPGTYGFGVHFADVTFGRVVESRGGYAWRPVP
jgi:glyoxylase-like metal-dependent hydrolase (beta-lactamase superfamily II)